MLKKYRAIFLSPHLDDAVFSCAAKIESLVKEGPVLVINVFTRFPEAINRGVLLGDHRYKEEETAAKLLGFESIRLGELDASFRRPAYRSIANVFRPPVAEDLRWLPALQVNLTTALENIEYDELYAPMAIGWHVDHVLTHEVARRISKKNTIFYEDVPYVLIPHMTRLRLMELGHPTRLASDDPILKTHGIVRDWLETTRAYAQVAMMKKMSPWIVRIGAVAVIAIYFARLMRTYQKRSRNQPKLDWVCEIRSLDKIERARKIDLMYCYKSQTDAFFLDRMDCEKWHNSYSEGSERFWRLKNS